MEGYRLNEYIRYKKIPNKETYHLYNGMDDMHYTVREKEIRFWEEIKASTSVKELAEKTKYSHKEIMEYLRTFTEIGLLNPPSKKNLPLKKSLTNINRNKGTELLEVFLGGSFVLGIMLLIIKTITSNSSHLFFSSQFLTESSRVELIVQAGAALIVSILLHELGHLLFAVNRDILIPSLTLNWKKGLISVDTTGVKFIDDKAKVILVFFGGPFINLFLSVYSFLAAFYFPNFFILTLIGWVNFFLFLYNMCIFFAGSDGGKIINQLFQSNVVISSMNLLFYVKNRTNFHGIQKWVIHIFWLQKVALCVAFILLILKLFI